VVDEFDQIGDKKGAAESTAVPTHFGVWQRKAGNWATTAQLEQDR
jgi:hypothetical protein